MFIPVNPEVRLINNNILFSDTVLPLKDLGSNLVVTSISKINEFAFEDCLKTIFEVNPGVVFNVIQYSRRDKKIYFYTDRKINVDAWNEKNISTYKPIQSTNKIIDEIDNLLGYEDNLDEECISLYDVSRLVKSKYEDYKQMINAYRLKIGRAIYKKHPYNLIHVDEFDYDNNELMLETSIWDSWEKMIFKKSDDGDLYIYKSESHIDKDLLLYAGDLISDLYDECMDYKDFNEQVRYGILSTNSDFKAFISKYAIMFSTSGLHNFKRDFELIDYTCDDDYDCKCNSNMILNKVKGHEEELLKNIFVKIDDCPKWSQEKLREMRKEQIEKKRTLQKRLELKRKLFPWI